MKFDVNNNMMAACNSIQNKVYSIQKKANKQHFNGHVYVVN
jgi:hypothetical protein